jgi:endonuclease/exonuclease/phosphatase family metal-dependent hydrolase
MRFVRSCLPLFLVSIAVACSDDKEASSGGASANVVIETFNIGLAGAFVPNEAARRGPVIDAISKTTADIVCIQEAWFQSDKDAIVQAAKAKLPYAVSFKHDLNTPLTDATDDTGQTPPAPTTPPCGGDQAPKIEAAVTCLKDNCSTIPGSEQGKTTSSACAQEKCIASAGALLTGTADDKRCYGCFAPNLPTETFADIRTQCTTNAKAGLAFGGQSGVMILSKYPLEGAKDVVWPGTWNRRVVITATATLPGSKKLDVWCNHLTPVFSGLAYPYTGQYGGGKTTAEGWENEQLIQAKKLVALVEKGPSPMAVILGDLNASRAGDSPSGPLEAEGVKTLDTLEAVFTSGTAPDYVPTCTFCKDNGNGDGDKNTYIDRIYLKGIPNSAVKSTERVYADAVVDVAGKKVPLSDHYGLRSTIAIP